MRTPDGAPGGGVAVPEPVGLPPGWRWECCGALLLLRAESLASLGIPHAFTTRVGGVSAPPFDTLNLGRGVGDAPEAVRANRALVLSVLGRDLAAHVEASQAHGAKAAVVGVADRGAIMPGVDILVTRDPSVVLAVHCADCVPVILVDSTRGAVAAVHTGWRGTAEGAAAAAVRAMGDACGSHPGDLVVALGPAIGPCCYQVDRPVIERFDAWPWTDEVFVPVRTGRWRLDLWDANRRQLIDAGIPPDAVAVAGLCTACHRDLLFSHRRDGLSGRMAALIAAPGA